MQVILELMILSINVFWNVSQINIKNSISNSYAFMKLIDKWLCLIIRYEVITFY